MDAKDSTVNSETHQVNSLPTQILLYPTIKTAKDDLLAGLVAYFNYNQIRNKSVSRHLVSPAGLLHLWRITWHTVSSSRSIEIGSEEAHARGQGRSERSVAN